MTATDSFFLLSLVDQPMLVIEAGLVSFANPAATALLGGHIVGEDLRIALR